jgi:nitrate/nitrite transporter NarK
VNAFGWHAALRILGVLIILLALPLAYTVRERPVTPERIQVEQPTASLRDVVTQPAFYLLLIGSMCSIAAVGGANQHLKLYLSLDQHYAQSAAAAVASLTLVASLAGRVGMGWLADHVPKKNVMLLIYLLVAASLPILMFATSRSGILLYAVVFGIGLGGEYMVIPLMAAELFGVRVLGRALGLILAADGIAEAVAPVLVGRLRDLSGNYISAFTLLIAFAITGALAVALLPSRRAEAATLAPAPSQA